MYPVVVPHNFLASECTAYRSLEETPMLARSLSSPFAVSECPPYPPVVLSYVLFLLLLRVSACLLEVIPYPGRRSENNISAPRIGVGSELAVASVFC